MGAAAVSTTATAEAGAGGCVQGADPPLGSAGLSVALG